MDGYCAMILNRETGNTPYYMKINGYILLMLEMILLAADVFLAIALDMERLSVKEIISISFVWASMFMLTVILYSCTKGRKVDSSVAFMKLVFAVDLCLFFDAGAWAVDRVEGLRGWNYFYNIGCNSMMLVSAFCFMEFVCRSLEIDKKRIVFIYRSSIGMMHMGILAEILNVWLGYFYLVDVNGVYVRQEFGSLLGYIPFVYISVCCGYLICKQPIGRFRKMNYLSYIVIPFAISIWYTLTGYPPTLSVAVSIGMLIVYGNIYINIGKMMELVEMENLRKDVELAWQRNQLMLSQIKPHFIFNCLGSIEELCRLDAERAKDAVHYFSKYLRANMDSISDKYLIPFSSELEHIHNYIWLEQMRFEEDLEFQEEIETTEFSLPPLTIQPLVENAVKHGMMGMEEGVLKVVLSVKQTGTGYEIQIRDNGAGFDPDVTPDDGRSHIGIQNVRESLQSKVKGTLQIESEIGKGTVVLVHIPKEAMESEDSGSR